MYERDYILARAIRHKSDVLMINYKILHNKVTRDRNNQKKKYYEGKIYENQGSAKSMWKALNGVLNHKGPEAVPNTLTPEIFNNKQWCNIDQGS